MLRSLTLVAALAFSATAMAEAPTQLQHQGRLFDSLGNPLPDGPHTLALALYDAPSGGTALWSENVTTEFTNGYFSTALGVTNPIDADTVDLDEVYLSIAVNGGPPIATRQRLRSVPYALLAQWAETATNVDGGTVNANEVQINGTTVIDGSGTIVGSVSWNDLTDIPFDIDDGDSTLADGLLCVADDVIRYDGANWGCVPANDHVHDGSHITTGVLDINRLPVGGGSTQVAAGDHVHSDLAQASHTHSDYADTGHAHSEYALVADLPSGGAGALLASYELDDSSAPFVDASGAGNDLTQPGGGLAAGSLGHSGDSVSFSGGILEAASGNEIADSPVMTAEMWIQPSTNLSGTQTILNKDGAYQIQQIDGLLRLTVTTVEGTCTVDHTVPTTIGSWYHVSAYYNGRLAAIVLNGTEATVACTDGPIAPTLGDPLYLGAEGSNRNEPFLGFVDEVRIWGVAPLQSLVEAAPDPGTEDSSCKAILDAGNSTGDGTYTIDVDGPGPIPAKDVHCDMVNGGWTYAAAPNVPFVIPFTGTPVPLTVPNVGATYDFTLYGASAGPNSGGSAGGRGAMVQGTKVFDPSAVVWAYVGGKGSGGGEADADACRGRYGGWNGGGLATRGGTGGGGATDLRWIQGDLYSRFAVAGGGGGRGNGAGSSGGGNAGHPNGSNGSNGSTMGGRQDQGGTNNSNANAYGSFGIGGSAVQCNDEGGGGGGWYGGSAGGTANTSAGGGSSYIDGLDTPTTGLAPSDSNGYIEYFFQ